MLRNDDIQIRDPFILPEKKLGRYIMYGTTDRDCWNPPGTGFDAYVSADLQSWEGPFPVFRPPYGFWADRNFWAPEVHVYRGGYFMFASFNSPDRCRGTQILHAEHPLGPFIPWSEGPVTPEAWECLDGTLVRDADGSPWIVFCHEWMQIADGRVSAQRLSNDLKQAEGEPVVLFSAGEAPWTTPLPLPEPCDHENYVTDGPFAWRSDGGRLLLIWSSFRNGKYAMGLAVSESGKVAGPWRHVEEPLFSEDGGHGMIFRSFGGRTLLSLHSPNDTPRERPVFIPLVEAENSLQCSEEYVR